MQKHPYAVLLLLAFLQRRQRRRQDSRVPPTRTGAHVSGTSMVTPGGPGKTSLG